MKTSVKALVLFGMMPAAVPVSSFAGGILTNTNQNVTHLRMMAQGATTDINAVYFNPAGLAFMTEGWQFSLNLQSVYQKRMIDATFPLFPETNNTRHYEGNATAPVLPSLQAAYKIKGWTFSANFSVVGGGGTAKFKQGLPMFDAPVMTALAGYGITPDRYGLTSSLDGSQIIYGLQLGASYRVADWLGVYVGGRVNIINNGYKGSLRATLLPAFGGTTIDAMSMDLDCTQSGVGVAPIIGADVKWNKLNVGLKYEFKTGVEIKNKTTINNGPGGQPLSDYVNGITAPNDIPALLTAALGYDILPTLRATAEWHYFFDKQADMLHDKQKLLSRGTYEYLLGVEWDVHKYISISGGLQITDFGATDAFQSDMSFFLDSYSLGFGAGIHVSPKVKINVAYMWTNYSDYTKDSPNYNGLPLQGKDVYSRTNRVFGLGVDLKL